MGDSSLFIVRVWRRREAFRATVRRVDDEQAQLFGSAADMARYFEQCVEAPADRPAEKVPPAAADRSDPREETQ